MDTATTSANLHVRDGILRPAMYLSMADFLTEITDKDAVAHCVKKLADAGIRYGSTLVDLMEKGLLDATSLQHMLGLRWCQAVQISAACCPQAALDNKKSERHQPELRRRQPPSMGPLLKAQARAWRAQGIRYGAIKGSDQMAAACINIAEEAARANIEDRLPAEIARYLKSTLQIGWTTKGIAAEAAAACPAPASAQAALVTAVSAEAPQR